MDDDPLIKAVKALLTEWAHTRAWTFGDFKDDRRGYGVKPRYWRMYPKTWSRLKAKMNELQDALNNEQPNAR